MAQVGIVMGSDSDMPIMSKAADILEELGGKGRSDPQSVLCAERGWHRCGIL